MLADTCVTVACAHTVPTPEGQRLEQVHAVLLRSEDPLIIGGDLNEPPNTIAPLLKSVGLVDALDGGRGVDVAHMRKHVFARFGLPASVAHRSFLSTRGDWITCSHAGSGCVIGKYTPCATGTACERYIHTDRHCCKDRLSPGFAGYWGVMADSDNPHRSSVEHATQVRGIDHAHRPAPGHDRPLR